MDNVKGFTNTRKINEEAAQWILLIEDTPELSKEQVTALKEWVTTSPVHRECLQSMVESWGDMALLSSVMNPREMHKKSPVAIARAWLITPAIALMYVLDRIFSFVPKLMKPIVVVPLAMFLFTWLGFRFISPDLINTQESTFATQLGEQNKYTLDDGSILWLNSDSSVSVEYSEQVRRVNLVQGEAHFEVSKDKSRPFEVYAGNRLVRALGTAFSVYRLEDSVEVLVTEGRVELAIVDETLVIKPDNYEAVIIADNYREAISSNDEITENNKKDEEKKPLDASENSTSKRILGELTAGQRISIPAYNSETLQADTNTIVEVDSSEVTRRLSWRDGKLVFAGESLEEVVREITRHTKIRIDVFDPELKKIRIGGQFKTGETESLFYTLESGFGISVNKVDDNHVELHIKEHTN